MVSFGDFCDCKDLFFLHGRRYFTMVFIYLFSLFSFPKTQIGTVLLSFPLWLRCSYSHSFRRRSSYPSCVLMLGLEQALLRISHFHCVMCSLLSTCQTHRPHNLCSSTESSCWDEVSEKEPCEECSGKGEYIALKDTSNLTFLPPKWLHFKHCCFVGFTNAVHKHRIT